MLKLYSFAFYQGFQPNDGPLSNACPFMIKDKQTVSITLLYSRVSPPAFFTSTTKREGETSKTYKQYVCIGL
jgi:hypothetical protein